MWKLRAGGMLNALEIDHVAFIPLHAFASHNMKNSRFVPLRTAVLAGMLGLLGTAADAFQDNAKGIYFDGGHAAHGEMGSTNSATVGMTIPWWPGRTEQTGALTGYWDVFLSNWHAPALDDGRRNYAQIGALYTWRYRFGAGSSPWFAEGGIGGSVMDHIYKTPDRSFSTAFQFTEVVGVGRSFGETGAHELSLRVQHFSNAGIKKPNPGETFLRLRYTYRF
jgi:lipid A 3-O-deacylase